MSRRFLQHADRFDWAGLQTLMLTGLLLILSAGLLLLPAFSRAYRTARNAGDRPSDSGDCMVFGKKLRNGRIDDEYRQRLAKAADLYRQRPRVLILLGGNTTPGLPSEARMGLQELQRLGLPDSATVILEEQSRHTLENLRNARELRRRHPVLLSNRYHLARCSLIAGSLGMEHTICAAETAFSGDLATYLKLLGEAFFILWFQTGRAWVRLIRNRRALDRVS